MSIMAEIRSEIKNLDPKLRDLRNLGLVFGAMAWLVTGWALYTNGRSWPYFLVLGLGFGLWGLLHPTSLRPLYMAWLSLAILLGYFVSRLLLILVFHLMVTPIGLVFRLMGKDLLDRRLKDRDSYWHVRPSGTQEAYQPERTEKMY